VSLDATPCGACERHHIVNPFFSAAYSQKIINMGLLTLHKTGASTAAVLDYFGIKLFEELGSN
jgi:hypothetical protein